jgi:hypothetical protein
MSQCMITRVSTGPAARLPSTPGIGIVPCVALGAAAPLPSLVISCGAFDAAARLRSLLEAILARQRPKRYEARVLISAHAGPGLDTLNSLWIRGRACRQCLTRELTWSSDRRAIRILNSRVTRIHSRKIKRRINEQSLSIFAIGSKQRTEFGFTVNSRRLTLHRRDPNDLKAAGARCTLWLCCCIL